MHQWKSVVLVMTAPETQSDFSGVYKPRLGAVGKAMSSLQLFCTHFLFCFLGIGMMGNADRIFGWRQAALIVATFAALLLVARMRERRELTVRAGGARPSTAPSMATAKQELPRAA